MKREDIIAQRKLNEYEDSADEYDRRMAMVKKIRELAGRTKCNYDRGRLLLIAEDLEHNQPLTDADQEFLDGDLNTPYKFHF